MVNISVQDLMKLDGNINLIDIRNKIRYNERHIGNAKNIDYKLLQTNPSQYLKRNEKYYIYCQHGITSSKLCLYLTSMGFNVVNIIGGYEAWVLVN